MWKSLKNMFVAERNATISTPEPSGMKELTNLEKKDYIENVNTQFNGVPITYESFKEKLDKIPIKSTSIYEFLRFSIGRETVTIKERLPNYLVNVSSKEIKIFEKNLQGTSSSPFADMNGNSFTYTRIEREITDFRELYEIKINENQILLRGRKDYQHSEITYTYIFEI